MQVKIDRTKCVGGGHCVICAPRIFAQDEQDGLVLLLTDHPTDEDRDAVRQAEELCPGRVISIVEN